MHHEHESSVADMGTSDKWTCFCHHHSKRFANGQRPKAHKKPCHEGQEYSEADETKITDAAYLPSHHGATIHNAWP